jgi:hypothetical protein
MGELKRSGNVPVEEGDWKIQQGVNPPPQISFSTELKQNFLPLSTQDFKTALIKQRPALV